MKTIILFLLTVFPQVSFTQWVQCNNGLADTAITALAVSGNYIIAGTYRGGVFFSSDNGDSWTAKNNGLTNLNITAIAVSGNTIFAGTRHIGPYSRNPKGGIFRSSDNGNNWDTCFTGERLAIYSITAYGDTILVCTTNGFLISYDNGDSWEKKNNGLTVAIIHNGEIYGWYYGGGYSRSNDYGNNWIEYPGFEGMGGLSVFVHSNIIYVGSWGVDSELRYGGLYRSTNNGDIWEYIFHDDPAGDSSGIVQALIGVSVKMFIGTFWGRVYFSTNNGKDWIAKHDGIYGGISSFAIKGDYIFAGTLTFDMGRGVFRALLDDFTSVEDGGIRQDYNIFPNPARNMAKLQLPEGGAPLGNFFLYNPLGVKVKEINYSVSDGGQIVEFDVSDLTPGIYFLTLRTEWGAVTRQFAVVR